MSALDIWKLGDVVTASDAQSTVDLLSTNAFAAYFDIAIDAYFALNGAYLPLAGGTLTGQLTTTGLVANNPGDNVAIRVQGGQSIRSVSSLFIDGGDTNTGSLVLRYGSSFTSYLTINTTGVRVHSSLLLSTGLVQTDNNILELRNGASAQALLLNNTWTSATTRETAYARWSSNTFLFGTEKGTLGGLARALAFQTDGTTRMAISEAGAVTIAAVGTTANVPLITTTGGAITAGSFGSAANTFTQGNDPRLSDARTPLSHTHGNITNAGAIGSTANLPLITTTGGVVTTGTFGSAANTFTQGNDPRLSDARTPLAHNHPWSQITSTPTTLSGYGITDALSSSTSSVQSGYFGDIFLRDDTNSSHYMSLTVANDLTANRVLSINPNNADRSISLAGNLTVSATATVSGTNTGDQTITLTGDVTGTGTGSFAATLANSGVTAGTYNAGSTAQQSFTVDAKGRITAVGASTTITPDWASITNIPTSFNPSAHTHGNITNTGSIGSLANLPLITTTGGAIITGSFGTAANTFCVGNDSRLSDARTPLAHTHGNITNVGAIGVTANVPIITGASGVLQAGSFGTAANTFCVGNDARLSDARTPLAHVHAAADVTSGTFNVARIPDLDASKITTGTINIARLPAAALERLVVVADQPARYALTTATVQIGDTVKQNDTGFMYFVVDDAQLNNAAGYEIYTAGAASSVPWSGITDKPSTFPPDAHSHGNITNGGFLGGTANLPLITTTGGLITTGSFGTTANTFCVGNDARLSDARTPLSHTHGNITNAGAIGATANLPVITTTSGVLTTGTFGTGANTFCVGNDARLSDARTPLAHTHGNITNTGAIGSTANLPLITTTAGVVTTGTFGTSASTFTEGNDARLSDAREWTATTVDQAEAEAGSSTTRRAWTSQRVRQNVNAALTGYLTSAVAATTYLPLTGGTLTGDLTLPELVVGGVGGARWRHNSGALEARNSANNAFAPITGSILSATNAVSATASYTASSGISTLVQITPTYAQSGTAGSIPLIINRVETSLGSGTHLFCDFQVSGSNRFRVFNTGNISTVGTLQLGGSSGSVITADSAGTRVSLRNSADSAFVNLWADQVWLGGSSFSRLGQRGTGGDIASGYNFNITGNTSNRDSTGTVNAVWYRTTGIEWFSEGSAAAGIITPRMSLNTTGLSVAGNITLSGTGDITSPNFSLGILSTFDSISADNMTLVDLTATSSILTPYLEIRDGTTPTLARLYNTYTSPTNYESGYLGWFSNQLRLGTEKGTGGGLARDVVIRIDGTDRAYFASNGNIDASFDTDTRVRFGRANIQAITSDTACFSHVDQGTTTGYALRQGSTGGTTLNAPTGQTVAVANNNVISFLFSDVQFYLGDNPNTSSSLFSYSGTTTTTPVVTGRGLSLYGRNDVANGIHVAIGGSGVSTTTGNSVLLRTGSVFSPTSGTATYDTSVIGPTINQTGGANGITRGLYVNPVLTAAADWRSIETANNTGWAVYAGGTAPSLFGGLVQIGGVSGPQFNNNGGIMRLQDSTGTASASFQLGSDLTLSRVAVGVLSLGTNANNGAGSLRAAAVETRNGTSATGVLVNNTWTSDTDRETGYIRWVSNILRIGADKGTVGGSARAVQFEVDGIARMTLGTDNTVATSGVLISGTDLRVGISGVTLRTASGALLVRDTAGTAPAHVNASEFTSAPTAFGSIATPAISRFRLGSASGTNMAGIVRGYAYASNLAAGDVVISANPNVAVIDETNLTADLAIRGSTGNVEINRGSLLLGGNDLTISRVSAGLVQIGTTANNALGGLLCTTAQVTSLLRLGPTGFSTYLRTDNLVCEVRNDANNAYGPLIADYLIATTPTGGSSASPVNADLHFNTQGKAYHAGRIRGRSYASNFTYGDLILSANPSITVVNGSNLTDDLVIRGQTGNVEINRGSLLMPNAEQVNVFNCSSATTSTVSNRYQKYSNVANNASGGVFEIAHLGGTVAVPAAPTANVFVNGYQFRTGGTNALLASNPSFQIRHTIASVSTTLSNVTTEFMTTSTALGVPQVAMRLLGSDHGVGIPQYLAIGDHYNTVLRSTTAHTLELRNGTNPQGFTLENTWTSATNRETGYIRWASNVLQIGAEKGSVGGSVRTLALQVDGTDRAQVSALGLRVINVNSTAATSGLTVSSPNSTLGRVGQWLMGYPGNYDDQLVGMHNGTVFAAIGDTQITLLRNLNPSGTDYMINHANNGNNRITFSTTFNGVRISGVNQVELQTGTATRVTVTSTDMTVAGSVNAGNSGVATPTGSGGAAIYSRQTGTSTGVWRGRIVAGGDNVAFLMGEYNSQAWLGGHNAALAAWAPLRINPDGATDLYLGNQNGGGVGAAPILTLQNSDGDAIFRRNVTLAPSSSRTLAVNGQVTVEAPNNTSLVLVYRGGDATTRRATIPTNNRRLQEKMFNTVAANLDSDNAVLNYTGDVLTSIVFTLPDASTITKTLNYTSNKLTSIVLTGATPGGITLTKTLTYTGDKLTGVTYT